MRKTLRDLTPEERAHNRAARDSFVVGQWYKFNPPTKVIPTTLLESLDGSVDVVDAHEVLAELAMYGGFADDFECHHFMVWQGRGRAMAFVEIVITEEGSELTPANPPDDSRPT